MAERSGPDAYAVSAPPWSDADPYTMALALCDDDGIVRSGAMHHGTDYQCTGHAHYAGEHIRCISPGHPNGMPRDVLNVLQHDPVAALRRAVERDQEAGT